MATDMPAGRPLALYPLRWGLALVFAYTGVEKLTDVQGQAAIVAFMGLPGAETWTVVIGAIEVLAALAFLAGVMTRTAAAGMSLLMATIMLRLKVPGPFWADGWGIDAAVLAGVLTLAINGPGRPSLWSLLGREDPEPGWYRRLLRRSPRGQTEA